MLQSQEIPRSILTPQHTWVADYMLCCSSSSWFRARSVSRQIYPKFSSPWRLPVHAIRLCDDQGRRDLCQKYRSWLWRRGIFRIRQRKTEIHIGDDFRQRAIRRQQRDPRRGDRGRTPLGVCARQCHCRQQRGGRLRRPFDHFDYPPASTYPGPCTDRQQQGGRVWRRIFAQQHVVFHRLLRPHRKKQCILVQEN